MKSLVPLFALSLLIPASGFAQDAVSTDTTQYEEETSFDFEDDIVDGSRLAPIGQLVAGQSHGRTSRLLQLRSDFIDEIVMSWELAR